MMTEAEAREMYEEELRDIYDVEEFNFGRSRTYRNGVAIEQKLTVFIDQKGNKDAIEYLKHQGFVVEQKKKKRVRGYEKSYGNGAGYQITLSLQVQIQEDKEK